MACGWLGDDRDGSGAGNLTGGGQHRALDSPQGWQCGREAEQRQAGSGRQAVRPVENLRETEVEYRAVIEGGAGGTLSAGRQCTLRPRLERRA
jgi:hypothetical protein